MATQFSIESVGNTDRGLVRKNNEDSFRELPQEKFYVLADGMGGHKAGEVASLYAVEYLCSSVKNFFQNISCKLNPEEMKKHMTTIIQNTNLWIHHLGTENPDLSGMGTTMCSLLFLGQYVIYSHVGDSRIYRYRNKILTPLTKDHLWKKNPSQQTVKSVSLKKNCSENLFSKSHILSQAIGTSVRVIPEVFCEKVQKGDIYFMCSDGLTDLVDDGKMEEVLYRVENLQKMSTLLIELAKSLGGSDNITTLFTRVNS